MIGGLHDPSVRTDTLSSNLRGSFWLFFRFAAAFGTCPRQKTHFCCDNVSKSLMPPKGLLFWNALQTRQKAGGLSNQITCNEARSGWQIMMEMWAFKHLVRVAP